MKLCIICDMFLNLDNTKDIKMVLKKIDNRIRVVIENGVQEKHRSMFFLVGDKARDQVTILF